MFVPGSLLRLICPLRWQPGSEWLETGVQDGYRCVLVERNELIFVVSSPFLSKKFFILEMVYVIISGQAGFLPCCWLEINSEILK